MYFSGQCNPLKFLLAHFFTLVHDMQFRVEYCPSYSAVMCNQCAQQPLGHVGENNAESLWSYNVWSASNLQKWWKEKKAKTKIEADLLKFLFFVGTLPTPDFFADILDLEKVNGLENMTYQSSTADILIHKRNSHFFFQSFPLLKIVMWLKKFQLFVT